MRQQGLTCFKRDDDGNLHANFDLMDQLHERYMDTSALKDISTRAKNIKHRQRRADKITKRQVQLADAQLTLNKVNSNRQHEYSL